MDITAMELEDKAYLAVSEVEKSNQDKLSKIYELERRNKRDWQHFVTDADWEFYENDMHYRLTKNVLEMVMPPSFNEYSGRDYIYPLEPNLVKVGPIYIPTNIDELKKDLNTIIDIRLSTLRGQYKTLSNHVNLYDKWEHKAEFKDDNVEPWKPEPPKPQKRTLRNRLRLDRGFKKNIDPDR